MLAVRIYVHLLMYSSVCCLLAHSQAGAAVVLISISWAPKKKAPLSSAAPVSETTAVTTAPAVAEAEPSYAS